MFKVSLLPVSYRKYVQGRAMKDIISKVALLVMICLLIIYIGFEARNLLVKNQLKQISSANSEMIAKFPALEQYQAIYDNLKANEAIMKSIEPKNISSTEFVSKVINMLPSYVNVTSIELVDWFTSGTCTLKCVTSSFKDVEDCRAFYEQQTSLISSSVTTEIVKQYSEDGTVKVTFVLVLANSGTLSSDGSASVVEETTTAAATTKASSDKDETTTKKDETTTKKDETTTKKDETTTAVATTKKGA